MQEGLVITADKEKIMDDSKVDEVVSEVNDMKSFKLTIREERIFYTDVIINAENEEAAWNGYWEVVHSELDEHLDEKDWQWMDQDRELMEVDELDEDELDEYETELPRFTYDHKAV